MLHRCNVREWEWEGMGIDCTGMGGEWECKKPFPGMSNRVYYSDSIVSHEESQ